MNEFLQLLLRDLLTGLYTRLGQPLVNRLPRTVRIGCRTVAFGLIAAFCGVVLFTLFTKSG
jgi:hypothetical protein